MTTLNIYEAKTQLSRIVDRAAAGEDIVISRNGKPVARLCQLGPAHRTIEFGVLKGRIEVAPDFDAPLPEDTLTGFEGQE
jgi:antitoxin (DNA-binding transcriptional repressor) of toxin-antitoxin stability system